MWQPLASHSPGTFLWRSTTIGKLTTAQAALVLCLNIGMDPPDVVKTYPCAVLECWVDPHAMSSDIALEAIGANLRLQFQRLSLKIPYECSLDPSFENLRAFCRTLRQQAKDDAVAFYYNGHGVLETNTKRQTLWCFNHDYTQYIPVSLNEIQSWLSTPGVYTMGLLPAAGYLLQEL